MSKCVTIPHAPLGRLITTSMDAAAAKNIAETLAIASAAIFFAYKAISGYLYVDMSLALSSGRSRLTDAEDVLVITLRLKKGGRGSVRIHDVQARVSCGPTHQILTFVGFHRLSYTTEPVTSIERKVINWRKLSENQPLLRLPPDEETEFSCWCRVPTSAICNVEVAVLGRERSWFGIGQWKASLVSTPAV